ncbi:BTB/POZ domain-containing protein [Tanacetum coccineum]
MVLMIKGKMGLIVVAERAAVRRAKSLPRKVNIEFGEVGTGDLRVVLLGRQRFIVKLSVHKSVVKENSTFFAENGRFEVAVNQAKCFTGASDS